MIVLCPLAFAGKDLTFERRFLISYLSRTGKKGIVANEVWDAFRFRHIQSSTLEVAEKIIVHMRGSFKPENFRLKLNYEEEEPKDSTNEVMLAKTKSLLERTWAEIEIFITQEPEKYQGLEHQPKMVTLQEFLEQCMGDINTRHIVEDYFLRETLRKQD